ncbi:hypothetical protein [Gordonia sp. NPDC003376]
MTTTTTTETDTRTDATTVDPVTEATDIATNDSGTTDSGDQSGTTSTEKSTSSARQSISLRTLLIGVAGVVVVAAIAVLAWRLIATTSEVDGLHRAADDNAHAEKVALDYATGAAQMSFENPGDWRTRLTAGTTPELADRLRKASQSMEQLITPLRWSSTAEPIAATVTSHENGTYQVVAFVNVMTKNAQAPDGIESTATYKVTVDPAQDWSITEISGIGSNLEGAQQNPTDGSGSPAPSAPATPGN